jgi:hypothetical protein
LSKISRQVVIARTPVHISTPLSEEVLQSIVAFVEERFNRHDNNRSDDNKKAETLVITLLDVAAELFSLRQEMKRMKLSSSEAYAQINLLSKRLDEFQNDMKNEI